jgi:hydrogenase small subunit
MRSGDISLPDIIEQRLEFTGISRRDFVNFCGKLMVVAPFGLSLTNRLNAEEVAEAVAAAKRPPVIWLHGQECTGCTETLLRTSEPDLATLILDLISLDYHETVMAAAGHQAEKALHDSMDANDGKFVLVCEGSVPTKDGGVYLQISDKKGIDMWKEIGSRAAAVIAIGSCASWGGVQSQGENPTNAVGVHEIITDKPVVRIPGCPPNPYVFLATALEFAVAGTIPALDEEGRPLFAYDRVIHEHCPRRAHFDSGRFARSFGDEGHKQGWCLYALGCKGPVTHAPCSTRHFNETPGVWPIGIGAPCFGCTEKTVGFNVPNFQTADIQNAIPPNFYPGIEPSRGTISAVGAGAAGAVIGGAATAAVIGWKALKNVEDVESTEEKE